MSPNNLPSISNPPSLHNYIEFLNFFSKNNSDIDIGKRIFLKHQNEGEVNVEGVEETEETENIQYSQLIDSIWKGINNDFNFSNISQIMNQNNYSIHLESNRRHMRQLSALKEQISHLENKILLLKKSRLPSLSKLVENMGFDYDFIDTLPKHKVYEQLTNEYNEIKKLRERKIEIEKEYNNLKYLNDQHESKDLKLINDSLLKFSRNSSQILKDIITQIPVITSQETHLTNQKKDSLITPLYILFEHFRNYQSYFFSEKRLSIKIIEHDQNEKIDDFTENSKSVPSIKPVSPSIQVEFRTQNGEAIYFHFYYFYDMNILTIQTKQEIQQKIEIWATKFNDDGLSFPHLIHIPSSEIDFSSFSYGRPYKFLQDFGGISTQLDDERRILPSFSDFMNFLIENIIDNLETKQTRTDIMEDI